VCINLVVKGYEDLSNPPHRDWRYPRFKKKCRKLGELEPTFSTGCTLPSRHHAHESRLPILATPQQVYMSALHPNLPPPYHHHLPNMGSQPSSTRDTLSVLSSPYTVHGNPIPKEASTAPSDTQDWYADFWQKAACVPHIDGKNVIVFDPEERGDPDPRVRVGWSVIRLRQAYELLGGEHPRVVR
jgi:hypothetical protein